MASDAELKQRFFELLKSDEEFRLAVAGLLGLDTVINELRKLREDFLLFVKEQEKRWEENNKRWEEAFKRFESIERKLEEHDKRFARIELELGALSEATLTKFVYEEVERFARESGEKIIVRRRNVRINGAEIDMLIETDRTVYIIEVKTKPRQRQVDELLNKIELVQKAFTKPVKPILAGVYIGDEVEAYAKSKHVDVIRY
jgi:predicted nuclease with TOPRIM domain